jgi:Ca-activated chloride channel family protein
MMARPCIACLLVFLGFPAVGQDSSPHVAVPLIAFGAHHRPTSVSSQSLLITDQKIAVSGVDLVPGTDLPLELGVLIDTSNSRRGSNFGETLKALNQFVSETMRSPEDRVFLLTFQATPQMTEWLKKDQLQKTTVQVGVGGGTALYDSLAIACQQRLGPRDWTKPTRRILVLVSDGDDNQSRTTRGEAVSEALKSGAVIFTIDTLQIGVVSKGDKIMADFAELTGGESFDGVGRQEIPKVFGSIQELINRIYYLRYVPPSTPNKALHEVEVKPAPTEKLKLSYARKYFWNP